MKLVADWWSQIHRQTAPAEITFLIVTSLLSILVVAATLLVATERFSRFANPFVFLVVDALLMTCWFGGFVALPVFLKQRVCFGAVCKTAYASVIFAAVEWVLFAA